MPRDQTVTGGREATGGHIPGRWAISVGEPTAPPTPGFRWAALTTLARLESGHTPSRRVPGYWDGDIPWIGIRDATENHGLVLDDTAQHVTDEGIANSSARVLPTGTVCLSRTASVGYVVMMGRPMATSQDFVNWVCGPDLEPHYLKYILLSEQESIRRFAHGTTHQTMYYPEAKALHVYIPDVTHQKQVLAVLKGLDDLVANSRRLAARCHEMAHAAVEAGCRAGATRVSVSDAAAFENRRRIPLSAKERAAMPGLFPYFGATGQLGSVGQYLFDGVRVLVGEDGTVVHPDGTPVVQLVWGKYWVNNHAHVLRGTACSTALLRIALERCSVAGVITGAVQAKLSMGNLRSVDLLLPSDSAIDVVVTSLASAEKALLEEGAQASATRDELLPLLMSGRVVPGEVVS